MYGLQVRWSLADLPDPDLTAARLREYVVDVSLDRFRSQDGLMFKTWRMRAGDFFEGTYVFATATARDEFATAFRDVADTSPGSEIVGRPPVLIEDYEVVAVAAGPAGFRDGPGPGDAG